MDYQGPAFKDPKINADTTKNHGRSRLTHPVFKEGDKKVSAQDYQVPFLDNDQVQGPEGKAPLDKKKMAAKLQAAIPHPSHQVDPPKVMRGAFDTEGRDEGTRFFEPTSSVPFIEDHPEQVRDHTQLLAASEAADAAQAFSDAVETSQTIEGNAGYNGADLDVSIISEEGRTFLVTKDKTSQTLPPGQPTYKAKPIRKPAIQPTQKSTYVPALYQEVLFDIGNQEGQEVGKYIPTAFTSPMGPSESGKPQTAKTKVIDQKQSAYPAGQAKVEQASLFDPDHPQTDVARVEEAGKEFVLDIRSISKRLRKTKESFLLFEHEEGTHIGNI